MSTALLERVSEVVSQYTTGARWTPDGLAAAVIAAMREPTDAMLESSWATCIGRKPQDYIATELAAPKDAHRFKMRQRWRAMIDQALAEAMSPAPLSSNAKDEK